MKGIEKLLVLSARRFFRLGLGYGDKFEACYDNSDYVGQEASDIIRKGLESKEPFAISRFGYGELRTILTFLHIQEKRLKISKLFDFITGKRVEPWWADNTIRIITHNAGLFPAKLEVIEEYCKLTLSDLEYFDVIGSWLGGERCIKPSMPNTKFIRFHDFYHFLHEIPWTNALEGKRVLVVHPFSTSIQKQFKNRTKIFPPPHSLPEFQLLSYPAIQSIAGNIPSRCSNWFDALELMKSDITNIDFEIAILGCGAYGMPLAAFIKRDLKKKAIHLGGNTQILFGIKGSRWETDPKFSHIFNEHWVKPSRDETPPNHETIDSNCYW